MPLKLPNPRHAARLPAHIGAAQFDGFAGKPVQLDHGSYAHFHDLAQGHFGAAQLDGEL